MSRISISTNLHFACANSETHNHSTTDPCTQDRNHENDRTKTNTVPGNNCAKKIPTRGQGQYDNRLPPQPNARTNTCLQYPSRHESKQQCQQAVKPGTTKQKRTQPNSDKLFNAHVGPRRRVIIDSDDSDNSDDCEVPVQKQNKPQPCNSTPVCDDLLKKKARTARPKRASNKQTAKKSENLTLIAALPFQITQVKDNPVKPSNQRVNKRQDKLNTRCNVNIRAVKVQDVKVHGVKAHNQRAANHSRRNQNKSRADGKGEVKCRINHQTAPFLKVLPGEIRNKIYEYVIPSARIMIFTTSPKAEIAEDQKLWANEGKHLKQPRSRLYCALDREQLKSGITLSTVLLLVSQQVSQEVQHFLYSRTTFCFPGLNVACKFFREAAQQGVASIKSVELDSGTYGEPYLTTDCIFKVRFERKWGIVCTKLGTQLTSLANLKIYSHPVDWPLGDIEQTEWHKSLMRIVEHRRLEDVEIHLTNPWFSRPKMAKLRQKIEGLMMTSKGKDIREHREHQHDLMLIRKAEQQMRSAHPTVKCLRITLSPQQGQSPQEEEQQ